MDKELVNKAKELGFNISKLCENCLKESIRRFESSDRQTNKEDSSVNASLQEGLVPRES